MAFALAGACSDERGNRTADEPPPATTARALDAALPLSVDLGPSYQELPVSRDVDRACSFAVDEPIQRDQRSFVSNAAQQQIDLRVLHYERDQTALAAFTGALSRSSCRPSQFDDTGGRPTFVAVEGADTSFDIGFMDQLDAESFTVARTGNTVVVVRSRLHQGDVKAEPRGGHEIAARAIARLR